MASSRSSSLRVTFENLAYAPFTPRVEVAKGTFLITRSALIIPSIKWTRRTLYHSPKAFTFSLLVSVGSLLKRGVIRIESKPGELAIIHSPWSAGYYHWITESLPRAYLLKKKYPSSIPMLPVLKYSNYIDSLAAIGHEKWVFFPEGRNVIVKSPVITECPPRFATTSPDLLKEVRDCVVSSFTKGPIEACEVVYVSRAKARGRYVLNEKELIASLSEFNVRVVHFEDLVFADQVRLMASTKILVSIHGAALVNMIFMQQGGAVVELIPKKNGIFDYNIVRNSFKHDSCYLRLAEAMGHSYDFLESEVDVSRFSNTHMANIVVDTEALKSLVGQLVNCHVANKAV